MAKKPKYTVLYKIGEVEHNGRKCEFVLLEANDTDKFQFYALRFYGKDGQQKQELLFDPEMADAIANLILGRPKELDMGDARQIWTKDQVKKQLAVIKPALQELEKLAAGSGQMPAPIRRKITTIYSKINTIVKELENWAITSSEKAGKDGRKNDGLEK